MKYLIGLTILLFGITSCSSPTEKMTRKGVVIEVTSFKINANVDMAAFQKRDATIEKDFTSKQPGFLKRLSAVNDAGEYVVVVYWKSMAEAEASMGKFMKDQSVADYAGMINGTTMKMNRYKMF